MGINQFNVFVIPSADLKLASHIEFLARVSKKASLHLYESYKEALAFLSSNPYGCTAYYPKTALAIELRYKLFYERYRLVFRIIGNEIYVYDIQDCRQDIDKRLI